MIVGALAAGLAIGAGATAASFTAFADDHRSDGGASFAARLAEKLTSTLGLDTAITEDQVNSAVNAVKADQQMDSLQARLDQLEVEEDQATDIVDWYGKYPYADLIQMRPIGLIQSDRAEEILDRLVEKERISQEQADGIQGWYNDRPELPEGLERSGHRLRGHGGDGAGKGHHRKGDGVGGRFEGR